MSAGEIPAFAGMTWAGEIPAFAGMTWAGEIPAFAGMTWAEEIPAFAGMTWAGEPLAVKCPTTQMQHYRGLGTGVHAGGEAP